MLRLLQQNKAGVKIFLGVILGIICLAMVITLVPGLVGSITNAPSADTVAKVGSQEITVVDVQNQINRMTRGQSLPAALKGIYVKQVLDQLIFDDALAYESQKLGIQVTPQEETDRIRQLLPTAFSGGNLMGRDQYEQEVQQRAGMSVPDFEQFVGQMLLQEKFRDLVTGAVTVTPEEVEQEFHRQNEKVQIEYVALKPADLAATINPSDADLTAYFTKNQTIYQVPEKRVARYALLDLTELRNRVKISDDEVKAYYNQHLEAYKVPDRVHVEHILFKSVGKTDAEIAEVRKNAEDVLNKAKHGGNFEDLAKQYSEDASKEKGGDIGWIEHGQTVAEFDKVAFSLPKGSISDLVQTQYGFHIIKVLDRETAHVKTVDEVKLPILQAISDQKTQALADDLTTQLSAAVRQSNRQSMDDLAKKFGLETGETPPVAVKEPAGKLGIAPELQSTLFALRPGELSQPIRIESGFALITVKEILPGHAATYAEVRDKLLADYRRDQSGQLAKSRAEEIARRVKTGEDFDKVAKSVGAEAKTSNPFSYTGSVSGVGQGEQFADAFTMTVGQTSDAAFIGANWVVYQLKSRQEPTAEEFAKMRPGIEQQVLQTKREAAFEAFRDDLTARLKQQGIIVTNADALKRLST
ncbi:MAG: peptidylprolyl isomerase [Candidatus Acidiferrales bacterium]